MTTVNWERESGDRIEEFAAAVILTRAGRGNRIRPSKGDRGIDVQVPTDAGWNIYQVKRYSTNLSSKQKTEILSSWQRFMDEVLPTRPVSSWSLVTPLEPTPENWTWFERFTAGSGIQVNWIGLSTMDRWAAESPALVGYYFGDGEARLHDLMAKALSVAAPIESTDAGENLLTSVVDRMEKLNGALDEVDPFYRYELHIRAGRVDDWSIEEAIAGKRDELLVMETAQDLGGGKVAVLRVIARTIIATQLRPIVQQLKFVADDGSRERDALEKFMYYGAPLADVTGVVVSTEGPAGTTIPTDTELSAWVWIPDNQKLPPMEIRLLDPDGSTEVAVAVTRSATSSASNGAGMWVRAELGPGATFEFFLGAHGRKDEMRISTDLAVGHEPDAVLPTLRLMAGLTDRRIQLAVRGGLPLLPEWQTNGNEVSEAAREYGKFVEALSTLQKHTCARVLIPDVSELDDSVANEVIRVGALLDGKELRGRFRELSSSRPEMFDGWGHEQRSLTEEIGLSVTIGDVTYATDMVERREYASVRADRSGGVLRILPGDDPTVIARAFPRER